MMDHINRHSEAYPDRGVTVIEELPFIFKLERRGQRDKMSPIEWVASMHILMEDSTPALDDLLILLGLDS